MQTRSSAPSAATAIAAVLALTAAPALSQETAAPPLDGPIVNVAPVAASPPAVAADPAPAPVIMLPDPPAEEPAPVVEAQQAAPVAAPAARVRPGSSEPVARAAPQAPPAAAAPSEPEPLAQADPPVEEDFAPLAAQPAAEPFALAAPTAEQSRDITGYLIAAFAALLALIAALVAFAARRRRRSSRALAREAERARQPEPRPIVPEPAPMAAQVTEHDRAPAPTLRSTAAAVPLPARVPDSFEERDALIRRMVDAPPDRANPFTDRRARLKRARLILQSLGRRFGDAKPWIDLRDYPENWPEFARSTPDARPEPMRTRQFQPA